MTIRAAIWDLGGVLVRTEDPGPRQALADRLRLSRADLEHLVFSGEAATRAQRGDLLIEHHWEGLRAQLRLSPEQMQAFRRDFWGGDRLDSELIAYIRALRPTYRTALLSNNFSDLRQWMSEVWGILDAFDEIVISSEVGLMKPGPEIFRLTLERLGLQPQEAVFVDDFLHNIEGAQQVGLHTVHFRSRQQALAELNALLGLTAQDHER